MTGFEIAGGDVQQAEESAKAMNPTKVFLILAGALAAVTAAFLLTRPDTPTPASPETTRPDFSLTEAEAIDRVKDLEELNVLLYVERDPSLIGNVYSTDSRLLGRVRREISQLVKQEVTVDVAHEIRSVDVLKNTPSEIVAVETVLSNARFFDESGSDVTRSGRPEVQEIRVTLHLESDEWLIFDSLITSARPVD